MKQSQGASARGLCLSSIVRLPQHRCTTVRRRVPHNSKSRCLLQPKSHLLHPTTSKHYFSIAFAPDACLDSRPRLYSCFCTLSLGDTTLHSAVGSPPFLLLPPAVFSLLPKTYAVLSVCDWTASVAQCFPLSLPARRHVSAHPSVSKGTHQSRQRLQSEHRACEFAIDRGGVAVLTWTVREACRNKTTCRNECAILHRGAPHAAALCHWIDLARCQSRNTVFTISGTSRSFHTRPSSSRLRPNPPGCQAKAATPLSQPRTAQPLVEGQFVIIIRVIASSSRTLGFWTWPHRKLARDTSSTTCSPGQHRRYCPPRHQDITSVFNQKLKWEYTIRNDINMEVSGEVSEFAVASPRLSAVGVFDTTTAAPLGGHYEPDKINTNQT